MRWLILCVFMLWAAVSYANADCDPTEFSCTNGRCINMAWKCDDDDDCHDNSDELHCPKTTCKAGQFQCDNGKCIPERWVCDESDDCRDESDEKAEMCKNMTCVGYRCQENNQCIPKEWKCDSQEDCPKGDDELNCGEMCDKDTEFQCGDKKCISLKWRCDHHADCDDESDEKDCPARECDSVGEKRCDDGECINEFWWCDGDADCKDRSDEANCTKLALTEQTCAANEFQCKTPLLEPQCIHFGWKCDGDVDCSDRSDEEDCPDQTCRPDESMCDTNYCIKNIFFCDGDVDCQDGADEANCTNSATKQPTCQENQFDCGNGQCIADGLICNGENDCDNFADEALDLKCPTNNTCQGSNNGGCMHTCVPPVGGETRRRCECHEGFELKKDSETECDDINECEIPGTCSQLCKNNKGSYKCECKKGYSLINHRYCKADGEPAELILSDRHELRRYGLNTYHYSPLLEQNVSGAVAIDFDIRKGDVFWTDVQSEKVYLANLNTNEVKTIVSNDIRMPDGLAVDWVHRNLYLSDTGLDKIEVARLDGTNRKILVSDDLDEPRALVVDPYHGWMYWTDWGSQPKIEKCGMNGKHRKAIVTTDITWPNGLTIDYEQKRLYWVDAKLHTIGSTDLEGNNYKLVLKNHVNLGHPFAITVFEDYLYWTDWMSNAVHKVSKFGTGEVSTIALDLKTPMDIYVYHIYRQPFTTSHCGDGYGGCSHLCLPKPHLDKTDNPLKQNYECACPDGMVLEDVSTCVKSDVAVVTKKPQNPDSDKGNPNRPLQTHKPTMKPAGEATTEKSVTEEPDTNFAGTTEISGSQEETTSDKDGLKSDLTGGEDKDGGEGQIAGIAIAIIASIVLIVLVIGFLLLRRYKQRNKKTMNFDNPVYRKTTTDDQLIMGSNGSNLPQSMQPLNDDNEIV